MGEAYCVLEAFQLHFEDNQRKGDEVQPALETAMKAKMAAESAELDAG